MHAHNPLADVAASEITRMDFGCDIFGAGMFVICVGA
jgi:hypothetical protein